MFWSGYCSDDFRHVGAQLFAQLGAGFDTRELASPGHYGLGMMHERAEAVQAHLTVTSQPGHGTEVRLRWPATLQQEAL